MNPRMTHMQGIDGAGFNLNSKIGSHFAPEIGHRPETDGQLKPQANVLACGFHGWS